MTGFCARRSVLHSVEYIGRLPWSSGRPCARGVGGGAVLRRPACLSRAAPACFGLCMLVISARASRGGGLESPALIPRGRESPARGCDDALVPAVPEARLALPQPQHLCRGQRHTPGSKKHTDRVCRPLAAGETPWAPGCCHQGPERRYGGSDSGSRGGVPADAELLPRPLLLGPSRAASPTTASRIASEVARLGWGQRAGQRRTSCCRWAVGARPAPSGGPVPATMSA